MTDNYPIAVTIEDVRSALDKGIAVRVSLDLAHAVLDAVVMSNAAVALYKHGPWWIVADGEERR